MPTLTLAEVAALTGGRVDGDASRSVSGCAPPHAAGPDDLTFVFGAAALAQFLASPAGAAIVSEKAEAPGRDVVRCRHPQLAMAQALAALHPDEAPAEGVHPSALVDPSAEVGARVRVGPYAVVEAGARLLDDAVVGASCFVGRGSVVGEATRLHAHVTLYHGVRLGRRCIVHSGVVLGADGFGFVPAGGRHVKIPQVAGVEVGDDVEIGANSCVDRGTMTPTRIGSGTKIDNLVQVGHNCEIGERVILCGQVALAGSTIVEDDVVLAGQVGAAGHLRIGRGVVAAARAGIISSVGAGEKVGGHPHTDVDGWLKSAAALRHLPELRADLRRLARRVEELEGRPAAEAGNGGGAAS